MRRMGFAGLRWVARGCEGSARGYEAVAVVASLVSILCVGSPSRLCAAPGSAGQIGSVLKKAQQFHDLEITDEDEQKIGAAVSEKIRQRYGVVQDPAIHKYVTLVGNVLAQHSERPQLAWKFIVLDTDGVNAFASPGGIVHITRGALGLIKSEAELAGVLAHEIGHVAHKHTVNAIKKNKTVTLGTSETLSNRAPFVDKLANKAYEMVLENKFDRGDELDADQASVAYTQKAGYAAGTLADFLARLDDRNKNQPERNGLFASHPETKERIDKVRAAAGGARGASGAARYKQHITYTAVPITAIASVERGSSGLTGSTGTGGDDTRRHAEDDAGGAEAAVEVHADRYGDAAAAPGGRGRGAWRLHLCVSGS